MAGNNRHTSDAFLHVCGFLFHTSTGEADNKSVVWSTTSVFLFEPSYRMAQQVLQPIVPPQSYSRMAGLSANQFQVLERLRQLRSWQEKQQEKLLQQQQQEIIALKNAQTTKAHVEDGTMMILPYEG